MDEQEIFQISRPHSSLMILYFLRSLVFGPFLVVVLPYLFFRYHSMRYRFDAEGVGMSWGVLFRTEINLTYDRIQDIHLTSNFVQRWFGLARVHVQTASGNAGAEMIIEGLKEYEGVRDFLYSRMRGHDVAKPAEAPVATSQDELVVIMREVRDELRATRQALEAKTAAADE